ncbi:MAG: hypothetical protein H6729_14435 [Deltaproteobacteria bacterium]|nr:hypothetical protein [Deltaproteobacteria bacterium]
MKNDRDLEARIDAALEAGATDRCAELVAAAQALSEDEVPPLEFAAIRGRLPIDPHLADDSGGGRWFRRIRRARSSTADRFRWPWSRGFLTTSGSRRTLALALAAAATVGVLSLRLIERAPSGVKGPRVDGQLEGSVEPISCDPVLLRVFGENGAPLPLRTIAAHTPIRIHSMSPCPSSVHAVELTSGRWVPIRDDEVRLEPGTWVLALIAMRTERLSPLSRTQVIATLQEVGHGASPRIEGETAFVDVYRLEVR